MPTIQKDRLPRDYSNGTVIFVQKIAPGAHIGEGYLVEIYENAIKVDEIKKRTKKDVYELIKDYKRQYNTNRAFQNEIEVFVTYPNKEDRGETAMHTLDDILYKKAENIKNILKRVISPENPMILRNAEENLDSESVDSAIQTPSPSLEQNITEEELADTLYTKIKDFILSNQDKEKDEIYNKVKQWLFKVNDRLKIYNNMVTANIKEAGSDSPIDYNKLKTLLIQKIDADSEIPDIGLEVLNMKPGNLEGVNEDSDTPEQEKSGSTKTVNFIDSKKLEFWKFASNVVGSNDLEDVFFAWGKHAQLSNEHLNMLYASVLQDVDDLFGYKEAQVARQEDRERYLQPFVEQLINIVEKIKHKTDIKNSLDQLSNELMTTFGDLFSNMVIEAYARHKAEKNPVDLLENLFEPEWNVATEHVTRKASQQLPMYKDVFIWFSQNVMKDSSIKETVYAKCKEALHDSLTPDTNV